MSDKYSDSETSVHAILSNLWALARGTLDGLRLSAAERLTLLLSAIAVAAIAAVLVTAALLFASIGAAQLLASITPSWPDSTPSSCCCFSCCAARLSSTPCRGS